MKHLTKLLIIPVFAIAILFSVSPVEAGTRVIGGLVVQTKVVATEIGNGVIFCKTVVTVHDPSRFGEEGSLQEVEELSNAWTTTLDENDLTDPETGNRHIDPEQAACEETCLECK